MRITIKQAAQMLQCAEQGVRMMIQLGKIPGACAYYHGQGARPAERFTYYITQEQVEKFMKGE